MPSDLQAARAMAECVRFAGDTLRPTTEGDRANNDAVRNHFYLNGLKMSRDVTPRLAAHLETVCERLQIPTEAIEFFVHAGADIQAECFAGSTHECIVHFSSALVDILDEEEFGFVAGHELGHFLLGHGLARAQSGQENLEYFMQQRAQEISADRLGLLACGSLDVAVRALMKTVSGLASHHLRFDIDAFLAQLRHAPAPTNESASHPSMLVRARALLWFSSNNAFKAGRRTFDDVEMAALDVRVQEDLDKYVDAPARRRINDAKKDVEMWMAAYEIVQDGRFDRSEQTVFAERFGDGTLQSLKNFLRDIPAAKVEDTVYERLKASRDQLEQLIPDSFDAELASIRQWR